MSKAGKNSTSKRLIVICGPSCVGKTPLINTYLQLFPRRSADLHKLVFYNSRKPRPGEQDGVDYHFVNETRIEKLRGNPSMLVFESRGDLQALDMNELLSQLERHEVLYEGSTFIGKRLISDRRLKVIPKLSVFISPLSRIEIERFYAQDSGISMDDFVTRLMTAKLVGRTLKQKKQLNPSDLRNIRRRAGEAFRELQLGRHFDHVLPNHDGEDSENWNTFPVLTGDAGRTLYALADILDGKDNSGSESWPPDLVR